MPKYNLLCSRDHKFEGWFASEKSYLDQKTKKLIACPICDNTGVRRAVMAPNVNLKSKKIKSKKSNTGVEKNCVDVGDDFAKEARKAMAGERDDHIYGTASDKEITDLHKEGIGAIRIPNVKDN